MTSMASPQDRPAFTDSCHLPAVPGPPRPFCLLRYILITCCATRQQVCNQLIILSRNYKRRNLVKPDSQPRTLYSPVQLTNVSHETIYHFQSREYGLILSRHHHSAMMCPCLNLYRGHPPSTHCNMPLVSEDMHMLCISRWEG